MKTVSIAVSANFTAEPLARYLAPILARVSIAAEVQFAPYNQVFQQLLDPTSLVATGTGVNVLLISLEEWMGETGNAAADFGAALTEASSRMKASLPAIVRLAGRSGPARKVGCCRKGSACNARRSAFGFRHSFGGMGDAL
jgi:hypothetical protein